MCRPHQGIQDTNTEQFHWARQREYISTLSLPWKPEARPGNQQVICDVNLATCSRESIIFSIPGLRVDRVVCDPRPNQLWFESPWLSHSSMPVVRQVTCAGKLQHHVTHYVCFLRLLPPN